jgi:hypothetical protein
MSKVAMAAVLIALAACTPPPFFVPQELPPIPGIKPGDSVERVEEVLGKPDSWRDGWWMDGGVAFRMDFQVWYYAGKGRVVFNSFDGHVVLSEADPHQPRDPTDQLH